MFRDKMAATATMMPNIGQNISLKGGLVPDWTNQEVSTGVSTWALCPDRTWSGPRGRFYLAGSDELSAANVS